MSWLKKIFKTKTKTDTDSDTDVNKVRKCFNNGPNNNCTFCKHYNYKYIKNKTDDETNHYCTNFMKLGETIRYDCVKFENKYNNIPNNDPFSKRETI